MTVTAVEALSDAQAMELLEKRRKSLVDAHQRVLEVIAAYGTSRRELELEIALVDRAANLFLRNGAAQ